MQGHDPVGTAGGRELAGFERRTRRGDGARDDQDGERWLWTITALKRPKGWRKGAGHRTSWLDARGAADEYWSRWLVAAALRPDLETLAKASLKAERGAAKQRAPRSAGRKRG